MMLCNEDVLQLNAVTKLNINEAFTYISYVKERNKLKNDKK